MSDEGGKISRRRFIAYTIAGGAALGGLRALSRMSSPLKLKRRSESGLASGLAVVHGSAASPDEEKGVVRAMTRRAVDALGGMGKLVRPGLKVVIKPNMAWARRPETGANTNPWVVAALAELCLEAGAGSVRVFDHTIPDNPELPYEASGIAEAAAAAGAEVPYVDRAGFVELEIPDAYALGSWPFYQEVIDAEACDVLINVPVLKDHGTSRLSMGLKNAFGMVGGERGKLHRQIHRKIVDLHRIIRVDLTVLDAYRVMRHHGPSGGSPEDVDNSRDGARRVVAGTDPVAVDAYGAYLFGYDPEEIGFIRYGDEAALGTSDWQSGGFLEEDVA